MGSSESSSPYGYCPICGAKGRMRERRPDGNDQCERGHTYKSSEALDAPRDLPSAVWEGKFRLCGVDLKCAVLDNGKRIIDAESLHKFFEALGDPEAPLLNDKELEAFAKWQSGTK